MCILEFLFVTRRRDFLELFRLGLSLDQAGFGLDFFLGLLFERFLRPEFLLGSVLPQEHGVLGLLDAGKFALSDLLGQFGRRQHIGQRYRPDFYSQGVALWFDFGQKRSLQLLAGITHFLDFPARIGSGTRSGEDKVPSVEIAALNPRVAANVGQNHLLQNLVLELVLGRLIFLMQGTFIG